MNDSVGKQKVLCIDDTPSVRLLVKRLLSRVYDFYEAADGLVGIELAGEIRPDLILVDLHMPHLTGYEVATRIKTLLPQTPIIALTADVTAHVRERALASGCDGYIAKPLDPDDFMEQVGAFLGGKRELLEDDTYRQAYQQTLVARLEEKVRELSEALASNAELNVQNRKLLERSQRRARLLEAASAVGRSVTSILNLDELLNTTVDIICDEFGFYYAGVFLMENGDDQWLVLRAGRGDAGKAMLADGHKLKVDGHSMIGAATGQHKAIIALDVGEEPVHFKNPLLPHTRSEMALPLLVGDEVIGALTVQSRQPAAFTDEDINALQTMADQLAIAIHNAQLHAQNQQLLNDAERRARLLVAAAAVGRGVTSILDLDELLNKTVDIICDAYGFYYAGIFLIDEDGEWAILHAGRGEAGRAMVASEHKLKVGGHSMIGAATVMRKARIALDVGEEPVHFKNPHLPHTRSEMALPLIVKEGVIGALTVQSTQPAAFSDEDVTSLQTMADQLAIAINNARLLRDLEAAHDELVRSKTFEAIATATGEAIHWVGNKAAPIPGSVARITEDLSKYLYMANALVAELPDALQAHKFAQMLLEARAQLEERDIDLPALQEDVDRPPLKRLRRMLSVESIFEDLDIIQNSARAILNIKEDLIGPARKHLPESVALPALLKETVASMGLPAGVAQFDFDPDVQPVFINRIQLNRVFINLIKNAMEAMQGVPKPRLSLRAQPADEQGFMVVHVTDTGSGIPEDQIDKIWMAFYTTKGDWGGTGLGLPACAQIIGQAGGKITVQSELGVGTTFSIHLPVAKT